MSQGTATSTDTQVIPFIVKVRRRAEDALRKTNEETVIQVAKILKVKTTE